MKEALILAVSSFLHACLNILIEFSSLLSFLIVISITPSSFSAWWWVFRHAITFITRLFTHFAIRHYAMILFCFYDAKVSTLPPPYYCLMPYAISDISDDDIITPLHHFFIIYWCLFTLITMSSSLHFLPLRYFHWRFSFRMPTWFTPFIDVDASHCCLADAIISFRRCLMSIISRCCLINTTAITLNTPISLMLMPFISPFVIITSLVIADLSHWATPSFAYISSGFSILIMIVSLLSPLSLIWLIRLILRCHWIFHYRCLHFSHLRFMLRLSLIITFSSSLFIIIGLSPSLLILSSSLTLIPYAWAIRFPHYHWAIIDADDAGLAVIITPLISFAAPTFSCRRWVTAPLLISHCICWHCHIFILIDFAPHTFQIHRSLLASLHCHWFRCHCFSLILIGLSFRATFLSISSIIIAWCYFYHWLFFIFIFVIISGWSLIVFISFFIFVIDTPFLLHIYQ